MMINVVMINFLINISFYYKPAHVDLPTPPFPEATTTISFTPSMAFLLGKPRNIRSCLLGICDWELPSLLKPCEWNMQAPRMLKYSRVAYLGLEILVGRMSVCPTGAEGVSSPPIPPPHKSASVSLCLYLHLNCSHEMTSPLHACIRKSQRKAD